MKKSLKKGGNKKILFTKNSKFKYNSRTILLKWPFQEISSTKKQQQKKQKKIQNNSKDTKNSRTVSQPGFIQAQKNLHYMELETQS